MIGRLLESWLWYWELRVAEMARKECHERLTIAGETSHAKHSLIDKEKSWLQNPTQVKRELA